MALRRRSGKKSNLRTVLKEEQMTNGTCEHTEKALKAMTDAQVARAMQRPDMNGIPAFRQVNERLEAIAKRLEDT